MCLVATVRWGTPTQTDSSSSLDREPGFSGSCPSITVQFFPGSLNALSNGDLHLKVTVPTVGGDRFHGGPSPSRMNNESTEATTGTPEDSYKNDAGGPTMKKTNLSDHLPTVVCGVESKSSSNLDLGTQYHITIVVTS